MAAVLGFKPKDGSSPSPNFKTGALNQTLPSRHNRGMTTLYFGLSYEAVMSAANSQSGDGAPFDSHQLSDKRRRNVITYASSFFILARAISESIAVMQCPDGCEPRHSI
jgi:hypothetical protein